MSYRWFNSSWQTQNSCIEYTLFCHGCNNAQIRQHTNHFESLNLPLKKYFSRLKFFHLLARKPNLEKDSIYSNKFFHNFHFSESSFTCPRASSKWVSAKTDIMSLCHWESIDLFSYPSPLIFINDIFTEGR